MWRCEVPQQPKIHQWHRGRGNWKLISIRQKKIFWKISKNAGRRFSRKGRFFTPLKNRYSQKKPAKNSGRNIENKRFLSGERSSGIQKMIQSEISGICFTVHPVTENRNQMVIEAGYGLGEAIVGGKITPDTYVIDKKKMKILDKNIADQNMVIVREEQGVKEVGVPK